MTFDEWLSGAVKYAVTNNKEQRRGQAYYNYLASVRMDLTNNIVGTKLDPFYDDRRLNEFIEYVKKNW
jgi:hypothetical protein